MKHAANTGADNGFDWRDTLIWCGVPVAIVLLVRMFLFLGGGCRSGLLCCRRRGKGHAANMDVDLDHLQPGHGLDRRLDIFLYLLCNLADIMAEQRKKTDLDSDCVLLAQLDPHALWTDFFWLRKLTMSLVSVE